MSMDDLMEATGMGEYPGYHGVHTQRQADGAIPNGTLVIKTNSQPNDTTPDGVEGKILGSMFHASVGYFYFVEWTTTQGYAVGCVGNKVKVVHNKVGSA